MRRGGPAGPPLRAAGVGFAEPPAALAVHGRDAWNWTSGNGRGDFHIGDGSVGLSMGVALGGGGRGVSRIWTNGGVENLFIGSAAYGASLSVLPGQVGVNNTNPGNTLDVDGGVRIRTFSHADTRPRTVRVEANGDLVAAASPENYLSIHPVAFNPEASGIDFQRAPYFRVTTTTVGTAFSTPLYFEDGADPSELRIWYEDNDSNKNLRIQLLHTQGLHGRQHGNVHHLVEQLATVGREGELYLPMIQRLLTLFADGDFSTVRRMRFPSPLVSFRERPRRRLRAGWCC